MIRWTQNTEAVQLPAPDDQVAEAKNAVADITIERLAHKQLRARVLGRLDEEERQIGLRLATAIGKMQARAVTRMGRVGYDLDAGEVVLADADGTELSRRLMTEAERRIAEQMPEPKA